jgi:hypothetical protein
VAAGLVVSVAIEGIGFAVLTWILRIVLASFIAAMTLSFRPGSFKPVVRAYSALWS